MFGISKGHLVDNLEKLQKRSCCYMGPTCDCKYGASGVGEQTGCPELSQAILVIKAMKVGDFRDCCTKADILIV